MITLLVYNRFKIWDLSAENQFLVNMKVSVCFEESSCILDLDIFKEKRLPKNVCDFAAAAKIQSKRSYARKSHCFHTWFFLRHIRKYDIHLHS